MYTNTKKNLKGRTMVYKKKSKKKSKKKKGGELPTINEDESDESISDYTNNNYRNNSNSYLAFKQAQDKKDIEKQISNTVEIMKEMNQQMKRLYDNFNKRLESSEKQFINFMYSIKEMDNRLKYLENKLDNSENLKKSKRGLLWNRFGN
tara:strand:- start:8101 stop:8547 length:447 start_codon:yes stop_codon:yes gene_type:complete